MSQQPKLSAYGLDAAEPEFWSKLDQRSPGAQYIIECNAFARGGTLELGGLTKEDHAKQILANHYPWIYRTWNDWSELVLWAWCNFEEVAATGCMNSSKSFSFSLMAWLEWSAAPLRSACILSSTTKEAIRSRLWVHIKKLRGGLFISGKQICHPCHIIDSHTAIQAVKGDDMHAVTSVAVQSGELEKAIGNIQGRHPQRMIVFCDEGEQTPDAIFSARYNLRGGTSFFRFVSAANAVNPSSAYGQFIEPIGGWNSVKHTDEQWKTKTGICLHFRGQNSPNVKAGTVVVPGLIQQKDIDAILAGPGPDSLEYWMYVEGFPAMSGVRNTVLSWAHILSAKANESVTWQGETRWLAALDPAFTAGGDKCVLRFARAGHRDDGKYTLGLEPPIHIKLQAGSGIPEDYQIADRVCEECDERNVAASDFGMDATAATALASIIEQRWKPGIRRINFGSAATERKMPGDDKTAKQRCKNRVAEMWFAFAALTRAGQVRGLDSVTSEQFCTRQYILQGERYILETKAEMKARTGGKSPDEADVSVVLGDLLRDIGGMESEASGIATPDAWEKTAAKYRMQDCYV